MADALLSIPLRIALEKLAHVIGQQVGLFAGAAHELEKIKNTLQSIKAVGRDAESKQVADESVRLWLSNLKSISHDIEDVVDEWQISGLENDGGDDDGDDEKRKVCRCFPSPYACFDRSSSHYKVACQVKEIREKLDEIAGDKILCNFSTSTSGGGETATVRSRRQTSSLVEESQIIGRVEDKEAVINRLVSGSSSGDGDGLEEEVEVNVTAIVGMGGLGKTTLARQIYHDGTVQAHFNKAVYWVYVSDEFDVMRLTKAILQEVSDASSASSFSELNRLQTELLRSMLGKRFLLILDDVWNEDAEKWETLRLSLRSGAQGSRILVTTRSENVANIMNSHYLHKLKGLSADLSWKLFHSVAFAGRTVEDSSEFESTGRKLVNKCKGVPLFIRVMGNAMYSKRTRADWQNILDSKMWSLPQVTNKVLPALLLSYYNLPPHLKQCFAYCSIYQKAAVMVKNELVKLWVAQGFIQPQGNREMEDIGEDYFNDLVAYSMFQLVEKYYTGETACQMHDLLHDLAEFITKDESFIFPSENSHRQCYVHVRHASLFSSKKNRDISIASCRVEKLRTLFIHGLDNIDTVLVDLLHQAKFLRVLLFKSCEIKKLPKTIGELKHLRSLDLSQSGVVELPDAFRKMKQLRHLDLSGTAVEELPESVSHLVNLHTLNLSSCRSLKRFWRGISRMVSLKNLEINYTNALECLPKGLGRNICLRSLCKFIVGGDGGCGIDELQQLNYLQGCLEIQHLERVASPEEARTAELWNKPHLHTLNLEISSERDEEEKMVMLGRDEVEKERMEENVLEGLRPHANLQELSLSCHNSSKYMLPCWLEDRSFSKLTSLLIWGFIHYEQNLPGLGRLPALKCLVIWRVGVRKLCAEFYYGISSNDVVGEGREIAFPKLEELGLLEMSELEEWELTLESGASNVMPSLCELMISDCPKLQALPPHLINAPLSKLTIEKCHGIKGVGCSSFPVLENFILAHVDEFFPSCLPCLPNLKMLTIDELTNETLPHGGWEQMVALHTLEISFCYELKTLPDGLTMLQSLEVLKIYYCKNLDLLPEQLGQLKRLKSLLIYDVGALSCLPDSLGQLESLEELTINGCHKLESLPHSLGQLQKLKSLAIKGAEALTSLPDSIGQLESLECLRIDGSPKLQSLPHALQDLSLLQQLDILNCPLLPEKCNRKEVDSHKISHIDEIDLH